MPDHPPARPPTNGPVAPPPDQREGPPGRVFDQAMRSLIGAEPRLVDRLVDLTLDGEPRLLPATLVATGMEADLLMLVGPGRLAQVEYQRYPQADMSLRTAPR